MTLDGRAGTGRAGTGKAGEDAAAAEALRRGGRILGRNVRTPFGELDLVWEDRGTIAFTEVRTRRSGDFVDPAASVTQPKRARVRRCAAWWLSENLRGALPPCRFDVVAIVWPEGVREPHIHWIEHAFE